MFDTNLLCGSLRLLLFLCGNFFTAPCSAEALRRQEGRRGRKEIKQELSFESLHYKRPVRFERITHHFYIFLMNCDGSKKMKIGS